jgi:repressor LexA
MKKRDTLTKKQQRVYGIIRDYVLKNGESPTVGELAELIGVRSMRTVTQYLESLHSKGLIARDRYTKRGIRLTKQDEFIETTLVPVFASAGCGNPSVIAERTFDEFISVSKDFVEGKKKNLFVIKAVGNSMVDAGILNGDMVLVEMTSDIQDNDIIVAIINDTAVIKKITFANNAIILNPVTHDLSYHPIILNRDFRVFGKVIKTIKVQTDDYQIIPCEPTP